MNDPTAFDTTGDEPVEARIVAWVLGEASGFEAAELERLCEERPELRDFRRRMRALHGLLTEAEAAEADLAWKLTPVKRLPLDEIFGEKNTSAFEIQKNLRIRRAGWRAFYGIAACLVLAVILLQLFGPLVSFEPMMESERSASSSPAVDPARESDELEKAVRQQEDKVEERRKTRSTIVRTKGGIHKGEDSFYGASGVDEDREDAIKRGLDAQDYVDAIPTARNRELAESGFAKPAGESRNSSISSFASVPEPEGKKQRNLGDDPTRADLLTQVDRAWELTVPADPAAPSAGLGGQMPTASSRLNLTRDSRSGDQAISRNSIDAIPNNPNRVLGGENNASFALAQVQELSLPADGLEGKVSPGEDAAQAELAELIPAEKVLTPLESMAEIAAAENPFSTFSLNISDTSFQLAKAAIAKGERPDPAGIKIEQFYNAVDYGDPAPGSDEPVAAKIEQAAHPVIPGRNLVRVALRAGSAGRAASQPLRLTLLVDQSGSMVREDRRAATEYALEQLGLLLTPQDRVNVIGFSRRSRLLADGLPGDQAGKLGDLVHQSTSEGGTNLEDAMKLGEQMAARHQLAGAQNRIVLFTDGAVNLGDADPARLANQVAALRQKGIAFDIAGIGTDGLNDRLLSEMARNGNGRYYGIGKEKDGSFARQLAGAFRPAAENVKVQVKFNPERVGRYQLLGFEKDQLRTEDFRDDSVDAAELAAEEAGVAIYQIEPLAEGKGEIGEVSLRFRDAASGEMLERSWTIPHDPATAAFDRATPSMQLAGLSLLAAEKLRGGPLADAIDFKQLVGPRAAVKQNYANSPRVGDMLRVIDALE